MTVSEEHDIWKPHPAEGATVYEHDDGTIEAIAWIPNERGQIERINVAPEDIREWLIEHKPRKER